MVYIFRFIKLKFKAMVGVRVTFYECTCFDCVCAFFCDSENYDLIIVLIR